MSFFMVDSGLFTSSIWLSGTSDEKVLWLWLLGNRDDDGVVRHRELAISFGTGLSRPAVDAALEKFSAPDPDSRTKDNDGRRIERTEDGFVRILNHERYYSRDYSTPRWRRWKERKGLKPPECVGKRVGPLANTVGNDVHVHEHVHVSRTEGSKPALPPADSAERAIRQSTDALRTKLYAMVAEMTKLDPKHRDPTDLMRLVTGYTRTDGKPAKGVVNAHLLTFERLEKSIEDAQICLEDWKKA